jgi:hypothetical protein
MVTTSETPTTDNDDSFWTDLRSRTVEWHDNAIRVSAAWAAQSCINYQSCIHYR